MDSESGNYNYWIQRAPHRLSRRLLIRSAALGGAGLTGAALFGCKSGTGDAGKSGTTNAPSAAAAQPRKGGTLKHNLSADPPGWSLFDTGAPSYTVGSFAYERLTALAAGPGHPPWTAHLIPELAVAMPEQPDPLTYIYTLRQGVKFQNVAPVNGRPMTVEDVKHSIDTINAHALWKADFASVSSVTAPDAKTLVVKTSKPDAALLNNSSSHFGWRVFPKEIIGTPVEKANVIGTGPFIRAQHDQGSKIVFKKNPEYWNPAVPMVDEFQYLIIPDTNSSAAAFKTKQIDILSGSLSCVQSEELWAAVKGSATRQENTSNSPYIAFNMSKPPFNDVRVRRAMSLILDRESARKALFCGTANLTGLLPTGLKPADIPDLAANIKYDPKQAKDLLTAAGFGAGFKADIVWTPQYNTGNGYADSLELYVGSLKQIGVTATPISVDYAKWIAEVYRPPFKFSDMLWGTSKTYYPDPNSYLSLWLHPKGIANQSGVNEPALTALIDKQQTQVNPKERLETIYEIQRFEAKNAYYAYRETGTSTVFVQNRVHDFVYHNSHLHANEVRGAWVDA